MESITLNFLSNFQELCKKYKINNTHIDKFINSKIYIDLHRKLIPCEIEELRKNYKIIDVDWLNVDLVKEKMCGDEYFEENKYEDKKIIVNNILDYYLTHKNKLIYEKTDYLCNQEERICICNSHADDFRKIYDGINYKQNDYFISWIKKNK